MPEMKFNKRLRGKAAELLNELDYKRHEVVLIPAPEPRHSGHKIRVAQNSNPSWYSRLCSEYQSIRGRGRKRYDRPRTFINRIRVVRTLSKIVEAGDVAGVYAERLHRILVREVYGPPAVTPETASSDDAENLGPAFW